VYGKTKWAIISEIDEEEALESTYSMVYGIIITTVVIFLVILLITLFLLNIIFAKPIDKLEATTKDLAEGDGDLTQRLEIKRDDEIGKVSAFINSFIQKVQKTVQEAKLVAPKIVQ